MTRTAAKPAAKSGLVNVPPKPAWDVGDRVVVAVWRATSDPRPGEAPGVWVPVFGRVVGVRRDASLLCYETLTAVPEDWDTPQGSRLRFAPAALVFDSEEAAQAALPTLTPPG